MSTKEENEDLSNQGKEDESNNFDDESDPSNEGDVEPYDFQSLPEYACKFFRFL